jgi:hypothetical protein
VKTNVLTKPIVEGLGLATGVGAFTAEAIEKGMVVLQEVRDAEHWLGRLGKRIRKLVPFGRR